MPNPHTPPDYRLSVAICGGGIAGFALASFLARCKDVKVIIYEAKPEVRTIGAGIAVWKRYWNLLSRHQNLDLECSKRGISIPDWSQVSGPTLRKSDVPDGYDFFTLDTGPIVLPRDVLLDVLFTGVNKATAEVKTGHQLSGYTVDGNGAVSLSFANGVETPVDVLIGADGVHSSVRNALYAADPCLANPRFSGGYAYRMKCFAAQLKEKNPNNEALQGFRIWCGKGRHVTSNAVGEYIQVTAYDNVSDNDNELLREAWVRDVPAEVITVKFDTWESDLKELLACMDVASRWAVHVTQRLPTFASGPIALIGDAAHAMTPHQGLGGGQGIEDAYILSTLLADTRAQVSNIEDVLEIYDEIRRPASQAVAERSHECGQMYAFLHPEFKTAPLDAIASDLREHCMWLLNDEGCASAQNLALSRLQDLVSASEEGHEYTTRVRDSDKS